MAQVVVTVKIMPVSPEVNLDQIKDSSKTKIEEFGGEVGKIEEEPIAFGLKAINIIFIVDEAKGGLDPLEESIKQIEGVNSVETVDVRRAIG